VECRVFDSSAGHKFHGLYLGARPQPNFLWANKVYGFSRVVPLEIPPLVQRPGAKRASSIVVWLRYIFSFSYFLGFSVFLIVQYFMRLCLISVAACHLFLTAESPSRAGGSELNLFEFFSNSKCNFNN